MWARQLNESLNNRYSFVINAVVTVCRETDNDRLNDLSVMCAEMTSCCNSLSAEWLGVLVALCCPISHPNFYMDVLTQVDIQDLTIHNSLAVFTSILIGMILLFNPNFYCYYFYFYFSSSLFFS